MAVALIVISFFIGETVTTSPTKPLEVCNTIKPNEQGTINLVFFAANKEVVEKYANDLASFSPFSTEAELFNFYFIQDNGDDCKHYKDIALICYSKDLLRRAAACPNDFVVVLKEDAPEIRSSSYMNVISLNSRHPPSVFPHEFGHTFAFLADEYVPATLPSGAKNCVKKCEEFGAIKDGCFLGCSDEKHYRSIDSGIMRTLSATVYGLFNEKIIREQMNKESTTLTGHAIVDERDCQNERYYAFESVYNAETKKTEIVSKSVESGCIGSNGNGPFKYTLYDENENKIIEGNFNPSYLFNDLPNEKTGQFEGDALKVSSIFVVKTPIIPQAKEIEISENKEVKTRATIEEIQEIVTVKETTVSGNGTTETPTNPIDVLKNLFKGVPPREAAVRGVSEGESGPVTEVNMSEIYASRKFLTGGVVQGTGFVSFTLKKIGSEKARNVLYLIMAILIAVLVGLIIVLQRKRKKTKRKSKRR